MFLFCLLFKLLCLIGIGDLMQPKEQKLVGNCGYKLQQFTFNRHELIEVNHCNLLLTKASMLIKVLKDFSLESVEVKFLKAQLDFMKKNDHLVVHKN